MTLMDTARVKPHSGLNLREKPNGVVKNILLHDEEVEVLEEVSFYRIKRASGELGYVHGSYLDHSPSLTGLLKNTSESDNNSHQNHINPGFELVTFSHDFFVGELVKVDRDFTPALIRLGQFAQSLDLKIWVTSSVRTLNEQVGGTIVSPAPKSCHHIGHAIDMNLLFENTLYNSKKLKRSNFKNLPEPIKNFIKCIRDDHELRWGGDFTIEDPVHIDDDLYRQQEILYTSKLYSRVDQLNG